MSEIDSLSAGIATGGQFQPAGTHRCVGDSIPLRRDCGLEAVGDSFPLRGDCASVLWSEMISLSAGIATHLASSRFDAPRLVGDRFPLRGDRYVDPDGADDEDDEPSEIPSLSAGIATTIRLSSSAASVVSEMISLSAGIAAGLSRVGDYFPLRKDCYT
jgi:hypothetical protein